MKRRFAPCCAACAARYAEDAPASPEVAIFRAWRKSRSSRPGANPTSSYADTDVMGTAWPGSQRASDWQGRGSAQLLTGVSAHHPRLNFCRGQKTGVQ